MRPNTMIGLTHEPDGKPVIRLARSLKVSIGVPKGRAITIYMYRGEWLVRFGVWKASDPAKPNAKKLYMETVFKSTSRRDVETYYATNKDKAALSDRPQKLPFFTFVKRSVIEEGGKPIEVFEPDFDAIEAHGECPKELDIVIMGDNCFNGEYQMWGAAELKCHGDGLDALRVLSLGNAKLPGWQEAKDKGERYFPISQCFTNGCPYAADGKCKPGATLNFQLANSMRMGATAYFHTTSIRSTYQIFSALETIKTVAERGGASIIGLPLKMVLAPFRSNHDGIPATQYGVSLELRASDMATLRRKLSEAAWTPQPLNAAPKMLDAVEELSDVSAPGIVAEFYEGEVEFEDAEMSPMQEATSTKTSELAEKLAAKRVASEGEAIGEEPKKGDLF